MENARTLHALDEFAKSKPKEIPKELDDYLRHVAASGDPIYQWSLVKFLFRQKLLNVIMEFYESCPLMDLPFNANLDPFNFETVKKRLLERYDFFTGVPFTIQRLAELLTSPKKQYNRLDKFMRALEKNIWVVSTREPANRENPEQTNLPNGVLSSVLHSNNVEDSPEEHPRHSELFENDEEDALPVNDDVGTPIPEDEGITLNSEEPVMEPDSENDPVPESADDCNVPADSPTENTVTEESEINDEPILKTPEAEEEEDETTLDKIDEQSATDTSQVSQIESESSSESKEEDKADEIVVTEVEDCGTNDLPDDPVEPSTIIETHIAEEVATNEERPDLKRKIDHVIDDDDEEEIAHKKLETELPYREIETESKPIEIENVSAEVIEPELIENDKIINNVEIIEAVEITDVEGNMESSELDDKVEMIVEESEQAMDVDESSLLSPMVQEDVVELMEASEVGNS